MPLELNHPVLAADAWGTLISIAFLVIAFIGWIMNLVNQNQPPARPEPPRPPRRPPRPQERRLQNEIDLFLEEVSGRPSDPTPIEVFEEDEPPRPTRVSAMEERRPNKPRRKPVGSGLKQRDAGGGEFDAAVREPNLREQLAERQEARRVSDAARRPPQTDSSWGDQPPIGGFHDESQSGTFQDDEAKALKQHAIERLQHNQMRPSSIIAMLRDPVGVRQAIVLGEILQRPRGLRD